MEVGESSVPRESARSQREWQMTSSSESRSRRDLAGFDDGVPEVRCAVRMLHDLVPVLQLFPVTVPAQVHLKHHQQVCVTIPVTVPARVHLQNEKVWVKILVNVPDQVHLQHEQVCFRIPMIAAADSTCKMNRCVLKPL